MGHLIRDKMYVSLQWRVVLSARAQIQMDQSELRMKPSCVRPLSHASSQAAEKAEEVNFKENFSFFTSLSAAKARVFGVKFIGLHGTVFLLRFWRKRLSSDLWPTMYGVVCFSILLEGGVTVSNNFTKRRQNGFKFSTRNKFATHLR